MIAGLRSQAAALAGRLLEYLPEQGRFLVVGALPPAVPPKGARRLHFAIESRPSRRRRRSGAAGSSRLAAHPASLPIGEGALDGLLVTAARGPLDLRTLAHSVRDHGQLVLAEPAPLDPMRRLLLRVRSVVPSAPETLTALFLHAGLADVRQELLDQRAFGRWIVTWGTVRKL